MIPLTRGDVGWFLSGITAGAVALLAAHLIAPHLI